MDGFERTDIDVRTMEPDDRFRKWCDRCKLQPLFRVYKLGNGHRLYECPLCLTVLERST